MLTATRPQDRNLPEHGETNQARGYPSPRAVAREAVRVLTAKGIEVRPAYLRRLVTRFIRDGYTTLDDVEPYFLTHTDPTGEAVIRNVFRERGF